MVRWIVTFVSCEFSMTLENSSRSPICTLVIAPRSHRTRTRSVATGEGSPQASSSRRIQVALHYRSSVAGRMRTRTHVGRSNCLASMGRRWPSRSKRSWARSSSRSPSRPTQRSCSWRLRANVQTRKSLRRCKRVVRPTSGVSPTRGWSYCLARIGSRRLILPQCTCGASAKIWLGSSWEAKSSSTIRSDSRKSSASSKTFGWQAMSTTFLLMWPASACEAKVVMKSTARCFITGNPEGGSRVPKRRSSIVSCR